MMVDTNHCTCVKSFFFPYTMIKLIKLTPKRVKRKEGVAVGCLRLMVPCHVCRGRRGMVWYGMVGME